ncbi:HET-domain-containing protein, partial [Thozetella sp. PMI_491]
MLPDASFITSMSKNKIPVGIQVTVYGAGHSKSGVIESKLFGTSRAMGREIKVLSQFHLRVASPQLSPSLSRELRYGRVLDRCRIDLALCRAWLRYCRNAHGKACSCPKWSATLARPEGINFRLVDVDRNMLVEMDAAECEYAALSYVWGPAECRRGLVELTTANIRSLLAPGSLDWRVGKTVLDAMEVVRSIGLRYLWVDRLCIMQNGDADKGKQIGQMDRIYGSAAITIVAATSEHSDAGISGVTAERSITQLGDQVSCNPPINVLLPVSPNRDLSPWTDRAWTLQEKLLSRRLLVFHHGVVDFYCASGIMHEDMPAKDARSNPP